jgi:hypothetical protein
MFTQISALNRQADRADRALPRLCTPIPLQKCGVWYRWGTRGYRGRKGAQRRKSVLSALCARIDGRKLAQIRHLRPVSVALQIFTHRREKFSRKKIAQKFFWIFGSGRSVSRFRLSPSGERRTGNHLYPLAFPTAGQPQPPASNRPPRRPARRIAAIPGDRGAVRNVHRGAVGHPAFAGTCSGRLCVPDSYTASFTPCRANRIGFTDPVPRAAPGRGMTLPVSGSLVLEKRFQYLSFSTT